MNKLLGISVLVVVISVAAYMGYESRFYDAPDAKTYDVIDAEGKVIDQFTIPKITDVVGHKDEEAILYGMRLLNETARLLPDNVGNGLNCNSCHMGQGKRELGAPYINTYNRYPRFNPRAQRVLDLNERINGCFQRSMNGKPIPIDSPEMQGMHAYMKWLGGDVALGNTVKLTSLEFFKVGKYTANANNGAQVYAAQCGTCHGSDGEGIKDQFGDYIFPPLWGDDSFNIGAGMARASRAGAFVIHNMPLSVSREAPLGQITFSEQEVVDVVEYFTKKPRPDFAGKENDWPGMDNPADSRY